MAFATLDEYLMKTGIGLPERRKQVPEKKSLKRPKTLSLIHI